MTPADPRQAVHAMIADGVPLEHIEEYINTLPLDAEQRSVLWLLAWSQPSTPPAAIADPPSRP
jgi:hypothetical protein